MNRPIYVDAFLAILGIAVSLAIFFAQGGGGSLLANLVPLVPILATFLLIGVHRGYLYVKKLRGALALILNARAESTMVIRVENASGDVWLEKKFRIEAINGGSEIWISKNEVLCAEVPMHDMPPPAKIISSSNPKVALRPKYRDYTETEIAGRKNHKYEWRYEICPPIRGKGGYVEYLYEMKIEKCETAAFTAEGGHLSYIHSAFDMDAEVSLISPSGYQIEVLKTYVENFDGTHTACSVNPILQTGNHVLTWKPQYIKGANSVCEYRLIANAKPIIQPCAER